MKKNEQLSIVTIGETCAGNLNMLSKTSCIMATGDNEKCVPISHAVSCAPNAGDQLKRLNGGIKAYDPEFKTKFKITTQNDGREVCAKKMGDGGWSKRLQISCARREADPEVEDGWKAVEIGPSAYNVRCVTPAYEVTCTEDAGNAGKRINLDYLNKNVPDTFKITAKGNKICAERTDPRDARDKGWGMRLRLKCTPK